MRIDKFLKVSRIIKRRTVANEACASGRVSVNEKVVKPSAEIKAGDIISIRCGEHIGHFEIISVRDTVSKDQAADMYRILDEDAYINAVRSET